MAHSKTSRAMVVHPIISGRSWSKVRTAATSGVVHDLSAKAQEILGGSLDPDKWLFSHCTIVASVDTEVVPGAKLGKRRVGSQTLDVRYPDFHITPESAIFVNNNGDSWERRLLKMAYPTFIGGQNYLEHLQVESESKGRLLDAVARDIGDSLYVDILVATDRRHTQLIKDIESRKMGTLSMGCTTDFTICSQCGHVAADETQACDCIKLSKLNKFIDGRGKQRVVAELCGHYTYNENPDAPGGVRFIEASWVETPAFPGAVVREIMSINDLSQAKRALHTVLAAGSPTSWSDTATVKIARLQKSAFDFGSESDGEDEKPAEPEKSPLEKAEDDVYNHIVDNAVDRATQDVKKKVPEPKKVDWLNDSVQKEAAVRYASALEGAMMASRTAADLIEGVSRVNAAHRISFPVELYRAMLKHSAQASNAEQFVRLCQSTLGRRLASTELRVLLRVGSLLRKADLPTV